MKNGMAIGRHFVIPVLRYCGFVVNTYLFRKSDLGSKSEILRLLLPLVLNIVLDLILLPAQAADLLLRPDALHLFHELSGFPDLRQYIVDPAEAG